MEIDHVVLATRSKREAEEALDRVGLGIARGRVMPGLGLSNLVVPLRHGQILEVHYPNGELPAAGAPPLLRFETEALDADPARTLIPMAWLVAVENEQELRGLAVRNEMSLIEVPAEGPGYPPYLLAGFGQNFERRFLPCLIHWPEGFPPLEARHRREPMGIIGIEVAGLPEVIETWCGTKPAGLRTAPGTSGPLSIEVGFADGGSVILGAAATG
jgi:hypothetical protein